MVPARDHPTVHGRPRRKFGYNPLFIIDLPDMPDSVRDRREKTPVRE